METTVAVITIVTGLVALVGWLTGFQTLPELFRHRIERTRANETESARVEVAEPEHSPPRSPLLEVLESQMASNSDEPTVHTPEHVAAQSVALLDPAIDAVTFEPAIPGALVVRVTNTSALPVIGFRLFLRDIHRWSERLNEPLTESKPFNPIYLRAPEVLESEIPEQCFVCGSDVVRLRAEGTNERGTRAVSEFLFSSWSPNPAGWLVCLEIDVCAGASRRCEYVFVRHLRGGKIELADDPRSARPPGSTRAEPNP